MADHRLGRRARRRGTTQRDGLRNVDFLTDYAAGSAVEYAVGGDEGALW